MESVEKASFVLDSELWEDDCSTMFDLYKDYIVNIWALRKARLYDENCRRSLKLHLRTGGCL